MLVFFAIFPPKEISKKIDDIRKRYDGNFERLAPHITLVPPFVPKNNIKKPIKRLEKNSALRDSFQIEIKGIGCFAKRLNNVVFLDVSEKDELSSLQEEMFKILEPYGAKKSKHRGNNFHITIAKRLKPLRFRKIYKELSDLPFKEKFVANEISCCVIEKNEPWQVKARIPLGEKQ